MTICFGSSIATGDSAVSGQKAPDFTLKNALNESVSLSDFNGKTIVIEWFNPECPFVKKFYRGGDMQKLQAEVRAKNAVWISINSSAPGKQGHITATEATEIAREQKLDPKHLLLDPDGSVGRMYGARTTPHMFVIDPKGMLAYTGAIDSSPSTSSDDIVGASNYVRAAVDALAQGKQPALASTEPYGCSVKY
jgi:peroxiredoxin